MEGINHSSRERHSWSDRRGGVKRDKNVLSPFGSQGTLPWPPRSSPPPPPLPFPGPFQPRHHHASSSHRPFVPIGSTPLFGHVNYSPAARLTTEEFDVAATARHPPLRSTPLPPLFLLCLSPWRTVEHALEPGNWWAERASLGIVEARSRPSIRIYISLSAAFVLIPSDFSSSFSFSFSSR